MGIQVYLISGTLLAFILLGFMMSKSIKKLETRPKKKGKKGRNKYMPEAKRPGNK